MFRRSSISRYWFFSVLFAFLWLWNPAKAEDSETFHANIKISDGEQLIFPPYPSLSPDGQFAVFGAVGDLQTIELFSVPIHGETPPVNLSGVIPSPYDVVDFYISPDSQWVVFLKLSNLPIQVDLYSIPIQGGPIILLNTLPENQDGIDSFQISPDSTQVVFRNSAGNLFSIPIGGGEETRINAPLSGEELVIDFRISPDSESVVYNVWSDYAIAKGLYRVHIDGGSVTTLILMPPERWMGNFEISQDSNWVMFWGDHTTPDVVDIFSVPLDGGVVTKLNNPLPPGGEVLYGQITPDSAYVVYLADGQTNDLVEIFSAPLTGGGATKLNDTPVPGGDIESYIISEDGTWLAYRADQEIDQIHALYTVPVAGGTPIKVSGAMVPGGEVNYYYSFSPDNSTIVFMADKEEDDKLELYSTPTTGGDIIKLNGPVGIFGLRDFEISGDGSYVVYSTDANNVGTDEIYRVPIHGGTVELLNTPFETQGTVFDYQISPNNTDILYIANKDNVTINELYVIFDVEVIAKIYLPLIR